MKANEAPEKIHIQPNAHDRWFEGDIPNGLPNGLFVEYVRKDAFIEKAEKFIYSALNDGVMGTANIEDFMRLFKKYMEDI